MKILQAILLNCTMFTFGMRNVIPLKRGFKIKLDAGKLNYFCGYLCWTCWTAKLDLKFAFF